LRAKAMRFNYDTISLDQIDSNDETYRITTDKNIAPLCNSIREIGLIHPPLLIKKERNYSIVYGFRRIDALKHLEKTKVAVKTLDSSEKELKKIQLAITDNVFQRKLNLIEQSRSLHLLRKAFPDNGNLVKEAAALGLPDHIQVIDKICKLDRLPDTIQQYIISNSISLPIALELSKLEKDTAVKIGTLFNTLKLGLNKQREVLNFLKEISIREDIPVPHILEEKDFKSIFLDDTTERAHKTRILRLYLKKRRYPQLSRAEDAYRKRVKELKLEPGTKLTPPVHFEGNTYTFCMDFKNLKELKARRDALERIINNPAIESIVG